MYTAMLSIRVGKYMEVGIVNSNILTMVVLGDDTSGALHSALFLNPSFPIFLQRLCITNLLFIFKSRMCGDEKAQNLEKEAPG